MKLIATCNFGLEAVVKRELEDLGYTEVKVFDGRVELDAEIKDIPRLNLKMRTCERILIKVAEFEVFEFSELFDRVYEIDWDFYISEKSNFIVEGKSVKSKLFSISDCQSITEKAIVKKLQQKHNISWFEKSEERIRIEVSLFKDVATISIDTSGDGLHKRGYRAMSYKAPISETIAASLVKLSFWNPDRILSDPFCGSGTIVIEAAMIAKNIAPGLMRKFDFESFKFIDPNFLKEEKKICYSEIEYDKKLDILASDISHRAIKIAKQNAEILDLTEDINFFKKDIANLELPDDYGVIITNPPYGHRIGKEEVREVNAQLGRLYSSLKTWSLYAISADENFERDFKLRADRNRKLYNGRIKCYYYQYYGPRPK